MIHAVPVRIPLLQLALFNPTKDSIMVLTHPPPAHIMPSTSLHPPNDMSTTATDNTSPPRYSAQTNTPDINEPLPSYNDPSHNFSPAAPPTRTKEPPPPEATSDLEANNIRVPPNSLDTTYARTHLAAPRPTRRARVCAGVGIAVIVLAAVLFFAGMFWPRHHSEERENEAVSVNDEGGDANGGEGVVFRRDGDVVGERLGEDVVW